MVTGISWGKRYVFNAKQQLHPSEDSSNRLRKLAATLTLIEEELLGDDAHICLGD